VWVPKKMEAGSIRAKASSVKVFSEEKKERTWFAAMRLIRSKVVIASSGTLHLHTGFAHVPFSKPSHGTAGGPSA
jgi:hypothetical protein